MNPPFPLAAETWARTEMLSISTGNKTLKLATQIVATQIRSLNQFAIHEFVHAA
jgi:hypothetical protein